MLPEFLSPELLTAFFGVVMIDLTLAGDNAVVIGLAAAGLPAEQRRKAIIIGILAATLMRIAFASVAVQLLQVIGLLLAGGLLLLWVAWKMYEELRAPDPDPQAELGETTLETHTKTLRQAVVQIIVADVSMSLDNVLAVAGAAREHPGVLVFGLALSIVLMGVAATYIARLLQRHHWIAWVGLAIILLVALRMVWHGGHEVLAAAAGH